MKAILRRTSIPATIFLLSTATLFFFLNFLINVVVEVFTKTFKTESLLKPKPITIKTDMVYTFPHFETSLFIYLIIAFISGLAGSSLVYKYISNFGKLKKNQKGSARFTTFKEIKDQYRDVPDKAERYKGGGGVPIARYKNRLFIDDSPVNNLIIGTTRSGKGETFVFSTIDIYSRAEKQASMILNDPKGELYSASKETLEGLGYHVEVLNLMNPNQSMSYNLLQLTIDAFFEGNYSLAQQYARSVAFMLYYDPKSKDPFWSNSSTDLCTALILALCEQCKNEPEKINMYNVALMLSDLGSRTVEDDDGNEISALDDFFNSFPENHPAKMQYATINFAGGQTRASILANTNAKLGVFTLDGTAKLTSQNTLDMAKIGFGHWIKGKAKPLTRIKIIFPEGIEESITTDSDGGFTLYHKVHLEEGNVFNINCDGHISKFTVKSSKDDVLEVEGENNEVKIHEVMNFSKPVALFMIVPDYDATFNVIASLYVKQVYTSLARIASNTKAGKCDREVIFILDEFGNMPAIEGMANIITVCLGRNIRFNLVIQAYSQLENLYGEDWKTIDGNCGNTLYLLTADESTAELISKKLGEKTIVTKSRSGQTFSLNKSKTESVDSRRLLTATEVMGLQEGEMIVLRVIKRQDKERKRIKSYPIYLTGKTALKYRWEYLADYYDTDKSINEIDIPCTHANKDLSKMRVDFTINKYKQNLELQEQEITKVQHENEEINNNAEVDEFPTFANSSQTENEIKEIANQMETSDEKVSRIKLEKANLRNAKRKEQLQKEKASESKINETITVKQLFPRDLLISIFGESEVVKYEELGIIDFKDIVISKKEEIDDNKYMFLLNKLQNSIEQFRLSDKKGRVS